MAGPGPVCVRCHDDKWRLSARHWCDACEAGCGPTGADREKAALLLDYDPRTVNDEWPARTIGALHARDRVARLAAALAAEREKARAPFLALADELASEAKELGWARGAHYEDAAVRIRRTATAPAALPE